MKTYQRANPMKRPHHYQTYKTYHAKPKVIEELKNLESIPQTSIIQETNKIEITNTSNQETLPQGSITREKRPERALYSVRQRQGARQETSERLTHDSMVAKYDDEYSQYSEWQNCDSEVDEKEVNTMLEDDRESVSNVSTAVTDSKNETCCCSKSDDTVGDILERTHDTEECTEILFDLVLTTEFGTINVKIYPGREGEEYEELLDQVCLSQKFDARTGLYFKINMLQQIKQRSDAQSCNKVDKVLNRLLDINCKLVMCEYGFAEPDQFLHQYITV